MFLLDSKISGGSIGLVRQKNRCTKLKRKNALQPESPTLPLLPKLGTNRPMVETPPPPTRYQQRNARVSSTLIGAIFGWYCPPVAVASSSQNTAKKA